MPEKVSLIDVTELSEILEDKKINSQRIAVIVGSRAGALFRSEEFYDELEPYSTRTFADMDERDRFSECYSILEDIYKRRSMSIQELKSFIEGQIYGQSNVENYFVMSAHAKRSTGFWSRLSATGLMEIKMRIRPILSV